MNLNYKLGMGSHRPNHISQLRPTCTTLSTPWCGSRWSTQIRLGNNNNASLSEGQWNIMHDPSTHPSTPDLTLKSVTWPSNCIEIQTQLVCGSQPAGHGRAPMINITEETYPRWRVGGALLRLFIQFFQGRASSIMEWCGPFHQFETRRLTTGIRSI